MSKLLRLPSFPFANATAFSFVLIFPICASSMQKNDNSTRSLAASACSSPILSHGSISAPDSDWTTVSDWSLAVSRQPSRPSTPTLNPCLTLTTSANVTPSGGAKTLADFASWMKPEDAQHLFAQAHAQPGWLLPNPRDDPTFEFASPRSRVKSHIPRPPNAFMLFRAEKVNAELPRDLPNRQQVVSVVAGQCWNMLDDKGKAEWHARARDMLKKHMERYPDYKFSPSRKSARKKAEEVEVKDGEDYIRHLREKYMQIVGPAVASSRPRKTKPRKIRGSPSDLPLHTHHPASTSSLSMHPSTSLTYPVDHSALGLGPYSPQVYPSYPQDPMPMPSSTPFMGSNQEIDFVALAASYTQSNSRTTTPSPAPSSSSQDSCSGASTSSDEEMAQAVDDDKTPTGATFGSITIPRHPVVPNISHFANVNTASHHLLGLHELSPYASIYHPQHQSQTQASVPSSSCPPSHQGSNSTTYFSLFPSGMQQGSSSKTSSPASAIPTDVRETFGVNGNSSPA